jgi:hypothetical protein
MAEPVNLIKKTVKELKRIAKELGIRKLSKKNKAELIRYIEKKRKGEPDSEDEGDARLTATSKNTPREKALLELMKGNNISDEDLLKLISCCPKKIRTVVSEIQERFPELSKSIVPKGGRGNNNDFSFNDTNVSKTLELKTTESTISLDDITKRPWGVGVQLVQIYIDSSNEDYIPLIKSYKAEEMFKEWYETVVKRELIPTFNIQGEISYEGYCKMAYTKSTEKASKLYEKASISLGARNLYKYLHTHRSNDDNKYLSSLWKDFSNKWMETHRFDENLLLTVFQSILRKKDIFICITKEDAYMIDTPSCHSLKFKEIKMGDDTKVMIYEAELEKATSKELYKMDIEVRFTWKNGGQGVHGLCFKVS